MDKDEITTWALANGWRLRDGHPSLSKPNRPADAIVRIVLKATVANLEIRKPAGKWEKMFGAAYAKIEADAESGIPSGLGLQTIPGSRPSTARTAPAKAASTRVPSPTQTGSVA